MRVLLLNQALVSPEEPGHTRHFEMAKFLQAHGHALVIVASDLNYQTGQRTVVRRGIFSEQAIDGVRILRSYIYPALHRSYFWRVISFFSFMLSSVWTAFQVRDVDLVLGTTPPIFQAASAWFVAWIRRVPFLLEVRDQCRLSADTRLPGRSGKVAGCLGDFYHLGNVAPQGRAYWGAYAAAGAALENLTQVWADELSANTHIRMNTLDPGAVRTALRARAYPGENPLTLPLPEDVMSLYLYLMGPDSRHTTGQALRT